MPSHSTTTPDVEMHTVEADAPDPTTLDEHAAALGWLADEFPDWDIEVTTTDTGHGDLRPLFVAAQDGHHPQAELSPAKLHSRLSDYLDREARRQALMN